MAEHSNEAPKAGGWSIWENACLRAPGFPAAGVSLLRAPAAATSVDRFAIELDRVAAARAAAIAALAIVPPSKPINKALRALKRGALPTPDPRLDAYRPLLDAVIAADGAREAAQQLAEAALATESRAVAERLLDAAAMPRLREALLWQNRAAVHGSISSLLRRSASAQDSKTREQRRLLALGLQRYCVKNDTIGFFGPVCWIRLTQADEPIALRPGPSLLRARKLYFEYWGIDTLAQRMAADPELRPFLRPRRMPSVWIDGAVLHHPNGQRITLPAPFARLLAAMDGIRSARAIAVELLADPALGLDGEGEVLELLAELERRRLCTWAIEIPTATFTPEQHLRELLSQASGPARERALERLEQLEARRDAVAAAAGDPARLDLALGELETTFEGLTSSAATRKGGQTYAGRTLLFEDCQRDLDVELGRPVVERLAPPLALILDSARWYTYTIATRYEAAFRGVFDQHQRTAPGPVPYVRFRELITPLFPGVDKDQGIAHEVAQELQAHWSSILDIGDLDVRLVERTVAQLRPAIDAVFAASGPGWPSARHHSPDVLIAADSIDAIRRGDYQFVLGEIHVGFNTVTLPCLLKEHPDPASVARLRERDLPSAGIAPVWSKARNRADFFSVSAHDLEVESGETVSARSPSQVLRTGEMEVVDVDGHLMVRSRDGAHQLHLTAFVEQHLIAESFARFRLLGRRTHMPRIVIDALVVQRESWQFRADALAFAGATTELRRLVMARRFAATHGMPRVVYAKADGEPKPFFVDFESPLLVDVLARALTRSRRVVFSEMSPTLEQCWLVDREGQRYTSELRLAATDPNPWQARRTRG